MTPQRDFQALLRQLVARQAGRPNLIDGRLCFVAMPFRPELEAVYHTIQDATGYCGLKCVKADDIPKSNRITDDIRDCVKSARIVIADLTESNPNVVYEVGLAHGREKRVVPIRQPKGTVPFDLSDIRDLKIDVNNLAALKSQLVEYLKNCISTIPQYWDRNYRPADWNGAYIKITSVGAPTRVRYGQPIKIRVTAKNTGSAAKQGYFSISFPDLA